MEHHFIGLIINFIAAVSFAIIYNETIDRKRKKPKIVKMEEKYAIQSGRVYKRYLDLQTLDHWWYPNSSFEYDCWTDRETIVLCWERFSAMQMAKEIKVKDLKKENEKKKICIVEKISEK